MKNIELLTVTTVYKIYTREPIIEAYLQGYERMVKYIRVKDKKIIIAFYGEVVPFELVIKYKDYIEIFKSDN